MQYDILFNFNYFDVNSNCVGAVVKDHCTKSVIQSLEL